MTEYRRHIGTKLLLLRGSLVLLGGLCWLSFTKGQINPGYFLAVALFFTGFITITGITITRERISVIRYLAFGLFPVRIDVTKEDHSVMLRLIGEIDRQVMPHSADGIDLLLLFIPITAKFQGIAVKNTAANGFKKQMHISLTDEEFDLVKSFSKEYHPTPQPSGPPPHS